MYGCLSALDKGTRPDPTGEPALLSRPIGLRAFHASWARNQRCGANGFDLAGYLSHLGCGDLADMAFAIAVGLPGPSLAIEHWGRQLHRILGHDLTGCDVGDARLGRFGRTLRPRLLAAIVGGEATALEGEVCDALGARLRLRLLVVPIFDPDDRTRHLLGVVETAGGTIPQDRFCADLDTARLTSAEDLLDPDTIVI